MKTGGGGSTNEQMRMAQDLVKSKADLASMGQYHQDLVKWARNVDKRYAWVVLGALWVMMAASLGSYRVYGLVYAKVTGDGVFTREEASWPVSMIFTVENIIGPFVSIVVYHISFRQSMLIGGILLAVGNGVAYWSDSLMLDILLIGFVQGIGFAFIFMPFMEIINNYFLRYRNAALGFALCGGTISVFGWSAIFRWILDTYHWRVAYLAMGAICCLNVLMVPLLKPNPRPTPPITHNRPKKANHEAGSLSKMSFRALSYQNSLRRQSTILISRRTCSGKRLDRNDSIVSVNPFASTVGMERKISRVISSGSRINQLDSEQGQRVQGNQLEAANGNQGPKSLTKEQFMANEEAKLEQIQYETVSLSEVAEENESEFEMSIVWSILKTPGFHVIWYLEMIYFWVFSIYCLVLVDFGVDRGCTREEAENLLSFQSIGEIIGRMVLTVLVDMRFLSNKNTVVLVLVVLAGLLVTTTLVTGMFWFSMVTVSTTALASLLYILLNGLLVDFLGERQVTIGYGMASFIVGVLIIFRPQAVGYFRDTLGSYDLLMVCFAIACVLGALFCMIEPLLTRFCCRKQTNENNTQNLTPS